MEEYSLTDDLCMEDFTNELNCRKYVKCDLKEIKCFFFFVDKTRSLDSVVSKSIPLTIPNTLLKKDLFSMIKENNKYNNKSYSLTYLLKYNFNIEESDLKNMCNFCFLETIDNLGDISFHPSIEVISNINSLFFVFLEKEQNLKKTKKTYMKANHKTNKNIKSF